MNDADLIAQARISRTSPTQEILLLIARLADALEARNARVIELEKFAGDEITRQDSVIGALQDEVATLREVIEKAEGRYRASAYQQYRGFETAEGMHQFLASVPVVSETTTEDKK